MIGFGGRDPHVANRVLQESSLGLDVIDVSPTPWLPKNPRLDAGDHRIQSGALDPRTSTAAAALRGGLAQAIQQTRRERRRR